LLSIQQSALGLCQIARALSKVGKALCQVDVALNKVSIFELTIGKGLSYAG